jgi:polyhydroxyalkanoate synthesis regulator phasin
MTQPRRTGSGGRSTRSGATRSSSSGGRTAGGAARSSGTRRTTTTASAGSPRIDKSVQAFREALERSVTLSRDRLQEVVDDAVRRGRMTRDDANELVAKLVSRGRRYTDDLLRDLERMVEQARKEIDARGAQARRELESRAVPARRSVERAAGRAGRAARDAADRPLAQADRLRRRAGASGRWPITGYDQLTADQVRARLGDLSRADLRKVRTQERSGKARKGILDDIDRRLA